MAGSVPARQTVADVIVDSRGVNGAVNAPATVAEAKVNSERLGGRSLLVIQNLSGADLFWGWDPATTTSTGIRVSDGDQIALAVSDQTPVYIVAASTVSNGVRVAEA